MDVYYKDGLRKRLPELKKIKGVPKGRKETIV